MFIRYQNNNLLPQLWVILQLATIKVWTRSSCSGRQNEIETKCSRKEHSAKRITLSAVAISALKCSREGTSGSITNSRWLCKKCTSLICIAIRYAWNISFTRNNSFLFFTGLNYRLKHSVYVILRYQFCRVIVLLTVISVASIGNVPIISITFRFIRLCLSLLPDKEL